jgi:hypothetical protein
MARYRYVFVCLAVFTAVSFAQPNASAHASKARSVRPKMVSSATAASRFNPDHSAALFVGVRQFGDRTIAEVPYAVDDAVDLAYAFAVEGKQPLVHPSSVVLALSGEPRKIRSIERLRELLAAGATRTGAGQTEILKRLETQTGRVGRDGIFILSIASHGFSDEGVPYVLSSSSRLNNRATAISTTKILDLAAGSEIPRSVVFLDACRERVTSVRATASQPWSRAPLLEGMAKANGQVVFYAAGAGQYAYDDDCLRNGVFTENVLAGLRCKAERDDRGDVTAGTLSDYVEKHVRLWLHRHHRDQVQRHATQVSLDGDTSKMPLALCGASPLTPGSQPGRVDTGGTLLRVIGDSGMPLWQHTLNATIVQAAIADLEGDGQKEVVVAAGGKVLAFGATGAELWSVDTNAPNNYADAGSMTVRTFTIGRLSHKRQQQIVALSADDEGHASRLSIVANGRLVGGYWHPGPLQHVAIAARTTHHAPKIIVTGINRDLRSLLHVKGAVGSIFLLDPKRVSGEAPPYHGKLGAGSQVWYGYILPATQTIKALDIVNVDSGGKRDISLSTSHGHILLDFEGKTLDAHNAHVSLINPPPG